MTEPIVKEIVVRLRVKTLQGDFDTCELVETALKNSFLNNSEFCLEIEETKVVCSPSKSSVN